MSNGFTPSVSDFTEGAPGNDAISVEAASSTTEFAASDEERARQAHPQWQTLRSTALLWIQHLRPICNITAAQLCEALSVYASTGAESLGDLEIIAEHQMFEICGSSLRVDSGGLFAVTPQLTNIRPNLDSFAEVSLRILNFPDFNKPISEALVQEKYRRERNEVHPMYALAASYLLHFLRNCSSPWSNEIQDLLLRLFAPEKSNNLLQYISEFCRQQFPTHFETFSTIRLRAIKDFTSLLTSPTLTPLHIAASLGLPEICKVLVGAADAVDIVSQLGTPLYCAFAGPSVLVLGDARIKLKTMVDAPLPVNQTETIEVMHGALE